MMRIIWRVIDKYICLLGIILINIFDNFWKVFYKREFKNGYKKILIIKLSALGDTIMMIPILRALRNTLPNTYICVLATEINAGAINNCPYLDKIKLLHLNNPIIALKTIIELHKQQFGLIVDFEQRIKISPLIAYFIGAGERIGFKTKGYFRDFLYTKKIIHRKDWHEFRCMSELVKDIVGKISDSHLEFWIQDEDKKWADEFLHKYNLVGKKMIVMHPGCGPRYIKGARAREWPKENFAKLGDILSKTHNAQILITGGKAEVNLSQDIASLMEIKPLVLAGKLNIGKLAALLRHCALLISGDTGIIHLGAACGTKTIAIFGPSDPQRYKPLSGDYIIVKSNLSCMPCQTFGIDKPKCKKFNCIRSITVGDILNNSERI